MSSEQLLAEVRRLRSGIRAHRDSTGHSLCWHHPALWGLLPKSTDPLPTVPVWPEFLRRCVQYRESLDEQLPHAPRSDDEKAIRELIEHWAGAVRRKDFDGILRDHALDVVMFDVPPPLVSKGIEAYRRTWDVFFSWTRDPVAFDIREMDITAGDDVAFVNALMRCAGREPNGEDIDLDFRLTIGLRKIDDRWKVTHEHHSIPASPPTK